VRDLAGGDRILESPDDVILSDQIGERLAPVFSVEA
jgi:hypothetical protein